MIITLGDLSTIHHATSPNTRALVYMGESTSNRKKVFVHHKEYPDYSTNCIVE